MRKLSATFVMSLLVAAFGLAITGGCQSSQDTSAQSPAAAGDLPKDHPHADQPKDHPHADQPKDHPHAD